MIRKLLVTGTLAGALFLGGSNATAQIIDFLQTPDQGVPPPTGTIVDFGPAPLPADFFEPGSQPFNGIIDLVGEPIDISLFGLADTRVERNIDPFDRADLPSPAGVQVDIQLVELKLVSAQPFEVITSGQPELWELSLDLPGPQQPGQMLATKTHANGGVFDAMLPVQPIFIFTKVSNPAQQVPLIPPQPFVLDFQDAPWVHDVDPLLGIFVPGGANFVPGVEETVPGDLSSQVRAPSAGPSVPQPGFPDVIHTIIPPQGTGLPAASTIGLAALAVLLLGMAAVFMMRRRVETVA